MKRIGRILPALLLALLLLAGVLTEILPAAGWDALLPAGAQAEALGSGGAERAGRPAGAQMTGRSKKKKNSATATPAATETPAPEVHGSAATPVPEGPITDPRSIADWLFAHDMQLPDNFITKKEARELGWDNTRNYVSDVAPGKSIGGDYFGNYEGILPTGKGITYREADCYYTRGKRNACRIIYSSDGRVWYTEDHYNTFEELFPQE